AAHAELNVAPDGSVTIRDLGSTNGTWSGHEPLRDVRSILPGSTIRCGASELGVSRPATLPPARSSLGPSRSTRSGPVLLNRPPRPVHQAEPEPIDPPPAPEEAPSVTPVGVVSVLAPLVLGLVMVRVLHSWTYALFMLMSPVLLVGSAVEARRRGRRVRRRTQRRYQADLAIFAAALDAAAADERRRLTARLPDLPTVLARAVDRDHLWDRRLHHYDALCTSLGFGSVPWRPPLRGEPRALSVEARRTVDDHSVLADGPVEIRLAAGSVVGIVGERSASVAVARSLLLQVAIHHGPADVRVAVLAAGASVPDWEWAKWLPHTTDGSGGRLLGAGPATSQALLADLAAESPPEDGPVLLVVIDDPALLDGPRAGARAALDGALDPVAVIVLAPDEATLPAACSTVLSVDRDGGASVHEPTSGIVLDHVRAAGLPEARARRVARSLARFEDPDAVGLDGGLPSNIGLLALLGHECASGAALAARWRAAGPDSAPATAVGASADGPLVVDLDTDGPHALVAGTTGAGKSELLRSLVAGLATAMSPDDLTFLLIDFKGGSAFDACARLPHTVGVVTDLDEHLASRALRCLEAELRHRERMLRAAGAIDLAAYRTGGPAEPLPRLVVVIDEFATLATELPDFVDALLGVAQRGRSLGVHLVLATQRPAGAVSEAIRANTNLRIALRVQDDHDSRDVIDTPDADRLPRHRPGRALVRLGPGHVVALQVARSTTSSGHDHGPITVRPFRFGRGTEMPETDPRVVEGSTDGPTDLDRIVAATREAFAAIGSRPPRRPWPDPLPADLDLAALPGRADDPFEADGTIRFALADRPDEQRQAVTGWQPDAGNLLVVVIDEFATLA
ncbi:MAG TPA: FtsK/SpoIIIE domain-containing protein, partial [Acidimicrobiales bacterium]